MSHLSTPLHRAADRCDPALLGVLLRGGGAVDCGGRPLLLVCAAAAAWRAPAAGPGGGGGGGASVGPGGGSGASAAASAAASASSSSSNDARATLEMLVGAGAQVGAVDMLGRNALHCAAESGAAASVAAVCDVVLAAARAHSADSGDEDAAAAFAALRALLAARDRDGLQPLELAISLGHTEAALELHAAAGSPPVGAETIALAVSADAPECLRALVAGTGAGVLTRRFPFGTFASFGAAGSLLGGGSSGGSSTASPLSAVATQCDIVPTGTKVNALELACALDNAACASVLLEAGADAHSENPFLGMTPAHIAASAGSKECLAVLYYFGVPVQARSSRPVAVAPRWVAGETTSGIAAATTTTSGVGGESSSSSTTAPETTSPTKYIAPTTPRKQQQQQQQQFDTDQQLQTPRGSAAAGLASASSTSSAAPKTPAAMAAARKLKRSLGSENAVAGTGALGLSAVAAAESSGGTSATAASTTTTANATTASTHLLQDTAVTPLHIAALLGHAEALELLLELGCDPGVPSVAHAVTPLHAAVVGGNVECTALLLAAAATASSPSLDAQTTEGSTALHLACAAGTRSAAAVGAVRIIEVLLAEGSDPLATQGRSRRNALHLACLAGSTDAAQLVLAAARARAPRGAVRSLALATDAMGATPLHLAARSGNAACINVVFEASGHTPGAAAAGLGGLSSSYVFFFFLFIFQFFFLTFTNIKNLFIGRNHKKNRGGAQDARHDGRVHRSNGGSDTRVWC
jgi:ankyrin repeat protein